MLRRNWNTQNRNQSNQGGGPSKNRNQSNGNRGKERNSPNRRYAPKRLTFHQLKRHSGFKRVPVICFAIEETVSWLSAFIWQDLRQHTPLRDDDVVLIDDGHADLLKLGFRHHLDHEPAL